MGILLRTSILEIEKMPFEGIVKLYNETKSLTSFAVKKHAPCLDEIVIQLQGKSIYA